MWQITNKKKKKKEEFLGVKQIRNRITSSWQTDVKENNFSMWQIENRISSTWHTQWKTEKLLSEKDNKQ